MEWHAAVPPSRNARAWNSAAGTTGSPGYESSNCGGVRQECPKTFRQLQGQSNSLTIIKLSG